MIKTKQGVDEILQDWYFDITYKVSAWFNHKSIEKYINYDSYIYYLGQPILRKNYAVEETEDKASQLAELFKHTLWFTYRKVFPTLTNNITKRQYISDTGWGCMIRAGQMIFAQALIRHHKFNILSPQREYEQLIIQFADDCPRESKGNVSPYSIQNISDIAQIEYGRYQQPGEWYNPYRICYIMEKIHERLEVKHNLEVISLNSDNPIVFETILQLMCKPPQDSENGEKGEPKKCKIKCNCQNQQNKSKIEQKETNDFVIIDKADGQSEKSEKSNSLQKKSQLLQSSNPENKENLSLQQSNSQQELQTEQSQWSVIDKQQQQVFQESNGSNLNASEEQKQDTPKKTFIPCPQCHEFQNSLLVFIGCKIGLENPEPQYLKVIDTLLSSKFSIGMIGGRPKQALYFPGRIDDKYIYLDPHIVQDSTSDQNIKDPKQLQTHFCEQFQTIQQNSIDSCLSLGFYISDLSEFVEFYEYMFNLKAVHKDSVFFWLVDEQPYEEDYCRSVQMIDEENEDISQYSNSQMTDKDIAIITQKRATSNQNGIIELDD